MPQAPNLFQHNAGGQTHESVPLATRMRPRSLDELVGQDHITGPGTPLRRAVECGQLHSVLLCGPAGCGKTSLADIIAAGIDAHFERLSAVLSGVADIRRAAAEAAERHDLHDRRTIVFVDEIHRLNKGQQDALLPHVENGTFTFIGATTENPYFTVISPLISRARVYTLAKLEPEHVKALLERALQDEERGLGHAKLRVDEAALDHLADACGGDARSGLNALEVATRTAEADEDGHRHVRKSDAEAAVQQRALGYDRAGDEHYDTISAYIKSMRGSDPDAALYWLAKMIAAGEDPRFIARRLVIQAAEDVGNADPMALVLATAAAQAVELVGMPEAQIPLAQATIYLAAAEKSNASYVGISRALDDVKNRPLRPVPEHLQSGPRTRKDPEAEETPYLYPHDAEGGFVQQEYLPAGAKSQTYYEPTDRGQEKKIKERLDARRSSDDVAGGRASPEA
jgi:putative ATPase